ncbi:MAG: DNA repair protein RecN [Formosimonas sp.]
MLNRLNLKNFVIVDQLNLDVRSGFTVLTGETGAGKSILLDALGLLLGERADANLVAQGADKADISAEFLSNAALDAWLNEADLSSDDDYILVRRVIDAQGKSRAFINGVSATLAQLKELGEQLVHIHGQHAHQQLLKTASQRDLLDNHAQLHAERQAVQQAFVQWQASHKAVQAAQQDAAQLADKLDTLQWQLEGLNEIAPQANEWDEISLEHTRLSHATALIQGSAQAAYALLEDDEAVANSIANHMQMLAPLAHLDERLNAPIELLDTALIHLQEAARQLNNYAQRADLSESQFEQLDERIRLWHEHARKLRVAPEDLHEHWLKLQAEQTALNASADIEQLLAHERAMQAQFQTVAHTLSDQRQAAAAQLSQQVTASMQTLNMTGGQFAIQINPAAASAHGVDAVEFLVAGHAGVAPQPLAKVASGGELARISLALSVITSAANPVPTLIFDEVDSGIGGAVAQVVGGLLAQIGQTRQVLCVTHLPQVAAQGQQHWQVSKSTHAGKTTSNINVLSSDERVTEIARMLGGVDITDTTRAHAQEMLG